jgi:hypothetical protein
MNIIDYYKGFEGNPEIDFFVQQEEKPCLIKLWEGYFDKIMQQIEPTDTGWTSLAYFYQIQEGWYDESPWKIPNNEEAYKQFKSIDPKFLDDQEKLILSHIIYFFEKHLKDPIFIEYS